MEKEAEPKEWPKTPAFQDEDTREMLDSTEEVKEGYYLFTSKTGGYSMLWPVDATKQSYQNNGNTFEKMILGGSNKEENYSYSLYITFDNSSPESYIHIHLNILSESLQYNGEFKEIKEENKSIYFAKDKEHLKSSDGREYTIYYYFGYIRDNISEQGLEYKYSIRCFDDENTRECNIHEIMEEERALLLMKSVNFSKVDIEDEKSE